MLPGAVRAAMRASLAEAGQEDRMDARLAAFVRENLAAKDAATRALARFLLPEWTPPDSAVDAIVKATRFDQMKLDITGNPQSFHFNPATFFRAGQVRDWENHLSQKSIAAIEAKADIMWPTHGPGDSRFWKT